MSRRAEATAAGLALLLACAPLGAQTHHHVPGWSKSEAERYLGARVRAQKTLASWGPVVLRKGRDAGEQPKAVGRNIIAGAEGKIVSAARDDAGNWSIVVEWGAPEYSEAFKSPVVWRTPIDRVHYASAVVEISRPTTAPVKPGHH